MEPEELLFNQIAAKLTAENDSVNLGKMMSSPAVKYGNQVFAFYHKKEMIFKLGKDFDPAAFEIIEYSLLSPFKKKPPMAGWFQIPYTYHHQWEVLARQALSLLAAKVT
ncbi:hypothetical protein MJD09_08810 [bacterium]|nr:hypothetical protein [bacterium]